MSARDPDDPGPARDGSDLGAALHDVGRACRTLLRSAGRATASSVGRIADIFAARRSRRVRGGESRLPRRRRRTLVWIAVLAPVLVAGFVLLDALASLPPPGSGVPEIGRALTVEADDGRVVATRGTFRGQKLTQADLSPDLARAIVAIEDRRFHQHWGIDPRGLLRAIWRNALGGGVREGGSTITQQYARLTALSQEKSLRRKLQEAWLALRLEAKLSKQEILLGYLNTAYFGAGAYGADAAARRYFGHPAKSLSLPEAAMLAGLVRAPSQLAPTRNFGGAKARADLVLQTMVETGAITPAAADAARGQSVTLRTPPETPRARTTSSTSPPPMPSASPTCRTTSPCARPSISNCSDWPTG